MQNYINVHRSTHSHLFIAIKKKFSTVKSIDIMVSFCLSNRKFEVLVGSLGEIVTISVHKFNVIIPRRNLHLII